MSIWKSKKLSDLKKEWEQKLQDSGFIDIEKEVRGERVLKQFSANAFRTTDTLTISSKQEFFGLIGRRVAGDKQMSAKEREIMTQYSQGIQQRQIIEHLQKLGIKCSRITITRTVNRYLTRWQIPTNKKRRTM